MTSIAVWCLLIVAVARGHAQGYTRSMKYHMQAFPLKSDCADRQTSVRCQYLIKQGACVSKTKAMRFFCPMSCGFCGKGCRDAFAASCPRWIHHNSCYSHATQMKEWCRKSCGFCKSPSPRITVCSRTFYGCCWDDKTQAKGYKGAGCPECRDWMAMCSLFRHDCYTGTNINFMRYNCPVTCGLCTMKNSNRIPFRSG